MKSKDEIIREVFKSSRLVDILFDIDEVKAERTNSDISHGTIVLHFKHETDTTGNMINYLYIVDDIVQHTETNEMMVVYTALYGNHKSFVRPLEMFLSEVDHEKYPDIKQKRRLLPLFNGYSETYIDDPLCQDLIFELARKQGLDRDGDILINGEDRYFVNEQTRVVIKLKK